MKKRAIDEKKPPFFLSLSLPRWYAEVFARTLEVSDCSSTRLRPWSLDLVLRRDLVPGGL